MGRKQRNNVDYFPHDCTHGSKMHIIEKKYGNDGYAVWFKMLEQLGHTDDHHIDISEETKQMYLSSVFNVSEELMISILDDLAKLGAIHKELWNDHRIIWSDKFIGSIEEASLYTIYVNVKRLNYNIKAIMVVVV